MQPEHIQHLQEPQSVRLSPDGGVALVDVRTADLQANENRSWIWRVPTDGSAEAEPITTGPYDDQPSFSPDGTLVAFRRRCRDEKGDDLGPPQLYVMDPAGSQQPRPVAEHERGVDEFTWDQKTGRIFYSAWARDGGDTPRTAPPFAMRELPEGHLQIFSVDPSVDPREDRGLGPFQHTFDPRDHIHMAVHPKYDEIAFVSSSDEQLPLSPLFDLYRTYLDGGTPYRVTRHSHVVINGTAYSPDGRTLWYRATEGEVYPSPIGVRWATDDMFDARIDTGPLGVRSDRHARLDPWVRDRPLLIDDDSQGVSTVAADHGGGPLLHFSVPGGNPEALVRFRDPVQSTRSTVLSGQQRSVLDFDRADGVLAAVVGDATSAGEVVVVRDDGRERVVTDFGRPLANAVGLGGLRPLRELPWTCAQTLDRPNLHGSADEPNTHAWIVLPEGEGPHPVVLNAHGGPYAQDGYRLSVDAQVLASAGIATILANPRGASGCDSQFGEAIIGDVVTLPAKDLVALLKLALDDPELNLDASRVGGTGGSYGGTLMSWMIGQEEYRDRVKVAFTERAMYDFRAEWTQRTAGAVFAAEWHFLTSGDQWYQSPISHAHRVRAKLLLLAAENDRNNSPEEARRMRDAVIADGGDATLVVFEGEDHGLPRTGRPRNQVRRLELLRSHFEDHL